MIRADRHRGRGAATLLMVTLMLFLATLASWHLARVMMSGQRLVAQDVLAREALMAAQSGIDLASVELSRVEINAATHVPGEAVTLAPSAHVFDNGASLTLSVFHHQQPGVLVVVSTGTASDGTGSRTIRQRVRRAPWMVHPPAAAVTAGAIEDLFDRPPALMRGLSRELACRPCTPADFAEPGRPYWIGTDDGPAWFTDGEYGSPDAPLIVIIDGDLDPASDGRIHGLVRLGGHGLHGLLGEPGGLRIHGAAVVAGDSADIHPDRVVHDPDVVARLNTIGPWVRIGGSWRDF